MLRASVLRDVLGKGPGVGRHLEACEEFDVTLETLHARQLRAMLRIRLRQLPPLAGEALTRAVLGDHAVIQGAPVLGRSATCLRDIELRYAVRDDV